MFIAAPSTYAKSTTNMTGWMVTSVSISGWRLVWMRLRPIRARTWRRKELPCGGIVGGPLGAARPDPGGAGAAVGVSVLLMRSAPRRAVGGEVEEDVVQARSLEADVVQLDAGLLDDLRDTGARGEPLGGRGELPVR